MRRTCARRATVSTGTTARQVSGGLVVSCRAVWAGLAAAVMAFMRWAASSRARSGEGRRRGSAVLSRTVTRDFREINEAIVGGGSANKMGLENTKPFPQTASHSPPTEAKDHRRLFSSSASLRAGRAPIQIQVPFRRQPRLPPFPLPVDESFFIHAPLGPVAWIGGDPWRGFLASFRY
jgi:hypothetical protein